MKSTQTKKRQLFTARPAPLVLEARIMFDGAGVDTAIAAAKAAEVYKEATASKDDASQTPVSTAAPLVNATQQPNQRETQVDPAAQPEAGVAPRDLFAVSTNTNLQEPAQQAQAAIRDFLASGDAHNLFAFFHAGQGEPTQAWLDAAETLRAAILAGQYEIQIREISHSEIGGAFAAFTGSGPDGQPTIFLNRDWLASGASPEAVTRVLVEEFGHALDHALNHGVDTLGDEGELFAASVLRFHLSDADYSRIAAENDRWTIHVDGRSYEVEQAAITFTEVYQGTPSAWSEEANQLNSVVKITGTQFRFVSADPSAPYFQGNNVSGNLIYVDGSGQTVEIFGVVSRLFKTNGVVHGFYFYAPGNTITIGDAATDPNERAFLFAMDTTKFAPGNSYRTSSDPVDTGLNSFIVPNSAPVANNDTATVLEDATTPVTGNLLSNDTDANGDTLRVTQFVVSNQTYTITAGSTQTATLAGVGTLTIGSNGAYSFAPAANYSGAVPVVTYTVSDGSATAVARLSISITPVNDAPAGTDKTVTVKEGGTYTFSAADFGFTDTNDNPAHSLASVVITSVPAGAVLTLNSVAVSAGQEIAVADLVKLKYNAPSEQSGNALASFTFQVRDNGGTANGGVNLDPTPNTITINVTDVNNAPTASPDSSTAGEAGGASNGTAGSNATGNVLSNDTDPDSGDSKTMVAVSSAVSGSITVPATLGGVADAGFTDHHAKVTGMYGVLYIKSDGSYVYVVDNANSAVQALRLAGNTLTETFHYTMRDGGDLIAASTLTITIAGANDAPVAAGDRNIAKESIAASNHYSAGDTTGFRAAGNVLTNDVDVDGTEYDESKTVLQLESTATGTTSGGTPAGTDLSLGGGENLNNVAVGYYVFLHNDGTNKQLLYKADGITPVTVTSKTGSGANTVVQIDAVGLNLAQGTQLGLSNNLTGLSSGGSNRYYTTYIQSAPVENVSTTNQVTLSSVTGTVAVGMTMQGVDTGGNQFSALVTAVNGNVVTFGGTAKSISNAALSFSAQAGTTVTGLHGTLVLNSDGSYIYTPTANSSSLSEGQSAIDQFRYRMSDAAGATSSATLTITVLGSGLADPVAAADAVSVSEDSSVTGNLLTNDTNATAIASFSWNGNSGTLGTPMTINGVGTLTVSANGSFTFAPAADYTGSVPVVNYIASNGSGLSASTLTITINAANDAPVAAGDAASAYEAGGYANATLGSNPSGNVLTNDSDVDQGDALRIARVEAGAGITGAASTVNASTTAQSGGTTVAGSYGSLVIGADGSYLYTVNNANASVQALNVGSTLTETFSYEVRDAAGATATTSLSITIHGANDAPATSVSGSTVNVAEGVSVAIAGLSVTDADDLSLTVRLAVNNGKLTFGDLNGATVHSGVVGTDTVTLTGTKAQLNAALGTLSYEGNADFSGTDLLTVESTDAGGLSDVGTVLIQVADDNRSLTVTGTTVNEASPFAFFTVGGVAGQKVSLELQATGSTAGHAGGGTDYAPAIEYYNGTAWVSYAGGLVAIPAGGDLLVRVAVLNDSIDEGAETFKLVAANKAGSTYEGVSTIVDDGTGTVFDSDGDEDQSADKDDDRSVSVDNITVNENSEYAIFTVTGHTGQRLALELVSGTATIGTDTGVNLEYYNGTTWVAYDGSYVTMPGATLLVRTTIVDDGVYEGVESFGLRATNVRGGSAALGVGRIVDDGSGTKYDGGVTGGVPNVSTTGLDDDRAITVSDPIVNEASPYAVFTVTGNAGEQVNLLLIDNSNNGSVTGQADINEAQTLQFWNGNAWENYDADFLPAIPTGGVLYVRASISAEHDTVYEGAEAFQLRATYAMGGTAVSATGTASIRDDGTGVRYPDADVDGTPATATTSLDDDRVLTLSSPTVNEASQWAVVSVTATPGQTLTLALVEGSGNGYADIDETQTMQVWNGSAWVNYTGANLTVPSGGVIYVKIDIAAESDNVSEGAETFQLRATYTSGASRSGSGTVTIVDNGTGVKFPGTFGPGGNPDEDGTGLDNDSAPGAPAAVADTATASEQGGVSNGTGGSNPSGNVRTNDTGTSITVVKAQAGSSITGGASNVTASSTSASNGTTLTGTYGSLVIGADGSYTYTLDNANTSVQALNVGGTLTETFSYQIRDNANQTADNTLTVTINGANDAPVASVMTGQSGTVGQALTPIVVGAFTDVDNASLTYTATLADNSALPAWLSFDPATRTFTGTPPAGENGSYSIKVTGSDGALSDSVTFALVVSNPTAPSTTADTATATEQGGVSNGTGGSNPSGNVRTNDTGTSITLVKAQAGSSITGSASNVTASSTSTSSGTTLTGTYGSLVIGADGSYTYTLDNANTSVQALNVGGTLTETFSYQIRDNANQTADNTLTVTINGANDAPVASVMTGQTGTVGQALTPIVVGAFTDVDNASLTYTATLADNSALPAWLSFDPATRTFTGTPPAGENGSYSIKVTGSDGALSDSVTFALNVSNPAAPAQTLTIVSMTKDTGTSASDFLTGDGSANRTVTGNLSAPLGNNEVVQVSFDGGTTWSTATTTGTGWSINDGGSHNGNWTIQARVVNTAANLTGPVAAQDVVLDTTAPNAPTVQAQVTTNTTPTLAGQAALGAGESLSVSINGATYSVTPAGGTWSLNLATAVPVSGSLTPLALGRSYEVAASIVDAAGNRSNDSTVNELTILAPPPPPPPPAPPPPAPPVVPPAAPAPLPPVVVQPVPFVPVDVRPVESLRPGSGIGARTSDALSDQAIRRNAELSDVYTRSEGFRTVVAKADEPALVVFRGVPDQYTESGQRVSLTIPADAFAHTQPKEVVRLSATLQDGQPLPEWVLFNAQTGQFTGEVPAGVVGELRIKVVARDMEGREATALFRVNIGVVTDKGALLREGGGKAGLSEQLKQQGNLIRQNERLMKLAKSAPAVRG